MSFFAKLFGKKKNNEPTHSEEIILESLSEEGKRLRQLGLRINNLLNSDRYIARSDFAFINQESDLIAYFDTLNRSGMLNTYCEQNHIDVEASRKTLSNIKEMGILVDKHNEAFIQGKLITEKLYLDGILKDVDPAIILDDDQRRVILTDEERCLVIAGAGAGKTTTVAAKVKYLVEKQSIDPKQILVVSFTNKAVQELKDKINRDLNINCPIATFHSTGNAILHKQNPEKLNIVDSSKLYFVIQDYFKSSILKNENLVNNLILFFASYFDAPYEGADLADFFNKITKSNFSTMKSELEHFQYEIVDSRSKKSVTIQNEVLRSAQEVEIANFLYLNGIDYQYEPIYQYDIQYARKPYAPDFIIRQGEKIAYVEHFGITEDGKNNRYSADALANYKKAINDKILLHREHGTTLIYTFSQFNDGRSITEHLSEELGKAGFVLRPRSNKEIMEKLVSSEENRYIRKLVTLICRFIENFKTNGYTAEEFNRMYHSTQNIRSRLFLDICNDCYLEYQRYLKENGCVDFQDMINESARILREVKEMKRKLNFKYVIVDEYQDISRQRFDLVSALSDVTEAKIIAVGDDWQSIYAFSGSDISLFTKFEQSMGYAKQLKIVKTYRNAQEVIDIAGNFIQRNPEQIQKELISPKTITDPVIIYTYDGTPKKKDASNKIGTNYEIAKSVEIALDHIKQYAEIGKNGNVGSILLLGRFGFDGDKLEKSGLFEYIDRGNKLKSVKYPKFNITFMTAHASKGLGYDNVIVVNGKNETYGFPSKIEDDPVLSFVIKGDRSIDYAEERRLFYVAMTRTKNRVYFIAPEQNPSEFLLELKHNYKNVVLRGVWNEDEPQQLNKKTCPICGYPLQFRYKNAYGLRLYLCTNEPEVCGFMTNEFKAGKLSICKCDKCRDGYLIVKPVQDSYFLGCTNYKKDGTGCGNSISKTQYYKIMNFAPDTEPPITSEVSVKRNKAVKAQASKIPDPTPETTFSAMVKKNYAVILYKGIDLRAAVETILICLENVSKERYYGVTVLVDVLRGSGSKRILDAKLNTINEYSALTGVERNDVEAIIRWLIDESFILQTKGLYPVLHPTFNSRNLSSTLTTQKVKKLLDFLSIEE